MSKLKFSPFAYTLIVHWSNSLNPENLKNFNNELIESLAKVDSKSRALLEESNLPADKESTFVAVAAGNKFLLEVSQKSLEISTKFSVRDGINPSVIIDVLEAISSIKVLSSMKTKLFHIDGEAYIETTAEDKYSIVTDAKKTFLQHPYRNTKGFELAFLDTEKIGGHTLGTRKGITTVTNKRDPNEYALRLEVSYTHRTRGPIDFVHLQRTMDELLSDHDILSADYKLLLEDTIGKQNG